MATTRNDTSPRPQVWAFGSGKGGVGKSVIAANTAVTLARRGARVVLVDADLGGANLHTLLGMANPSRTLSDFITRKVETLDDVLAPTPTDGLRLISGSRALMEMANPKYAQKEKILRHVLSLDVEHVILDLGAGSAFNVIDFFLAAHHGIVVVVPEPTSVENTYHFVKAAFYRRLKRTEPRNRVRQVLERIVDERAGRPVRSPRELIEAAAEADAEVGEALRAQAASFAPGILVNQALTPEQHRLADDISLACRDYFGNSVSAFGAIATDPLVNRSVLARRPAVEMFPQGTFSEAIEALSSRLSAPAEVARA